MSCIASAVSACSIAGSTCRNVSPPAENVLTPVGAEEPVRRVVGAEREQVGVSELGLSGGHRHTSDGLEGSTGSG